MEKLDQASTLVCFVVSHTLRQNSDWFYFIIMASLHCMHFPHSALYSQWLSTKSFHSQPLRVAAWQCSTLLLHLNHLPPSHLLVSGHWELVWHIYPQSATFSSIFPSSLWVKLGYLKFSPVAWTYLWNLSWLEIIYLFLDKSFISVTFIFKEIGFLLDVWGGICWDSASPNIMVLMTMATPHC
jgi:hypothetical protein